MKTEEFIYDFRGMNLYSNHWQTAITKIRSYPNYLDATMLGIQFTGDITEESLNITGALEGILKLTKIPDYFISYAETDLPGIKIPFPGINLFLNITSEDDTMDMEKKEGEIGRLKKLILKTQMKLSDESFINKAPAKIVEMERNKLDNFKKQLDEL